MTRHCGTVRSCGIRRPSSRRAVSRGPAGRPRCARSSPTSCTCGRRGGTRRRCRPQGIEVRVGAPGLGVRRRVTRRDEDLAEQGTEQERARCEDRSVRVLPAAGGVELRATVRAQRDERQAELVCRALVVGTNPRSAGRGHAGLDSVEEQQMRHTVPVVEQARPRVDPAGEEQFDTVGGSDERSGVSRCGDRGRRTIEPRAEQRRSSGRTECLLRRDRARQLEILAEDEGGDDRHGHERGHARVDARTVRGDASVSTTLIENTVDGWSSPALVNGSDAVSAPSSTLISGMQILTTWSAHRDPGCRRRARRGPRSTPGAGRRDGLRRR